MTLISRPPARSLEITQITEWDHGQVRSIQDSLAAEEPLQISINGSPLTVTMRTPGDDLDLAAGFLLTEGILESSSQLLGLRAASPSAGQKNNHVDAEILAESVDPESQVRNFFVASSCGICGKASIEAIRRRELRSPNPEFRIEPELLCELPEILRNEQAVFARTGGLHAAALFDRNGKILAVREDIGRHNAVDKVIGWALRNGNLPLREHVLVVSGRGGFEIVQKALAAEIPVVASVSAPSSLAVKLAREFGLTLVGFLRGKRFVVYSGSSRCIPERARTEIPA